MLQKCVHFKSHFLFRPLLRLPLPAMASSSPKRSLSVSRSTDASGECEEKAKTVVESEGAPAPKRGIFLVFEGIDRSGKSTQSEKLREWLESEGVALKSMRFPDRASGTGKVIDAYLRGKADSELDDRTVHLLFSANRHAVRAEMERVLQSGCHIICDRYTDSGTAYSLAKKAGMSREFCTRSDEGLIKPDRVIYMDLRVEDAKERGAFGEERYEREGMQKEVAAVYASIVSGSPSQYAVLDARGEVEELHAAVRAIYEQTVESCQGRALQYLR